MLDRPLIVNTVTAFLFTCLFLIAVVAKGQTLYGPVTISSISTNTAGKHSVVSIVGNAPLRDAQTWQDGEGYHVVIPNAIAKDSVRSSKGVKVRRVGTSVEFVIQAAPGANVNVGRDDNQLNISVQGKLESRPGESESTVNDPAQTNSGYTPSENLQPSYQPYQNSDSSPYQPSFTPRNPRDTGLPTAGRNGFVDPAGASHQLNGIDGPTSEGQDQLTQGEDGLLATVFSGTSLLIVMALGLFGLLVTRKLQSRGEPQLTAEIDPHSNDLDLPANELPSDPGTSLATVGDSRLTPGDSRKRKGVIRLPVSTPATLYGAYRIDQEVGKLILGQAHRMDVLASRATDDRRAIETSLMKTIASPHSDETGRRRAREALEEYGFVARHCASLLTSPDAFERTSAARTLGEIQSAAALPFLLEGLYDTESIVRNQAVVSIGELRIPAAIGALLDMARRHPDVPSSLVSKALSACSVEGLDFFDAMPEPTLLLGGGTGSLIHDITHLEPAGTVEDLPETSPHELFAETLAKSNSEDLPERAQAVKDLSQFQVQMSVSALSKIATCDAEAAVRALAIGSLASINHESVFSAILIGMADETREVRAAAARSLSRLEFDRADAYVRVLETAEDELLKQVGLACVKSGIVAQNIDRLASNDRRQAYEAFSLICLLVKAGMIDPVIDAIQTHEKMEVRLTAIHLLATTANPEVIEQYRQLGVNEGLPEDVKTALLESIYKFEQSQTKEEDPAPDVVWFSAEGEPEEIRDQQSEQTSEEQSEPELALPPEAMFDECDL